MHSTSFFDRRNVLALTLMTLVLFVVLPGMLDNFRLNLTGKYLSYAFVAVGLVLCWGLGGILSLGQGVFFGIGGYAMAMFLKLEASSPEATRIQSTPGIPDFMDWNQLTELPWFWVPFHSLTFTVVAIIVLPVLFASIIGLTMFKRRVSGVYFAIITQAIAAILTILVIGQQGFTGGVNGITDLRTLAGWNIRSSDAKEILYFVNAGLLMAALLVALWVRKSKLGRVLMAVRTSEDRVRFSGYDVANLKTFVFCLAAALSSVGGAMFTLQVGFMSPTLIGVVPSIEMVIFCAVGGRLSIYGAVYGSLLVNGMKTSLSESFPELWLFGLGGLFIAVVMLFPNGLAGVYQSLVDRFSGKSSKQPLFAAATTGEPAASAVVTRVSAHGTSAPGVTAPSDASSVGPTDAGVGTSATLRGRDTVQASVGRTPASDKSEPEVSPS